MALWGMNDSKTASGTVQIYANGLVSGTSTAFTTQSRVGDFITVANTDYMIISITSDTAVQVVGQYKNTSVTAQNSGSSYNLGEKPKYLLRDSNFNLGDQFASDLYNNYSNTTYGVSATEASVSNGAIREVVINNAGSGYGANATITVTTGNGVEATAASANAFVSTGRVTQVKFSNNGIGYTLAPTFTVSAPAGITFNANTAVSNTNATITLTSANSKFLVGDSLTYTVAAGNTAISPLVNNGVYFVSFANTTVIALASTSGGANLALVAGVSETGHTLTGQTAQVVPILSGVKQSYHAGWVKRNVGTGGRAGRVWMETLVASGTIAGDAEDNVFPNA